ncbi:MAG TPA: gamma-glutamyl-gamma-aminobutyrate hydrolase family protein [Candidatus Binatia bacterium]|nr:gamma-glutamyl-gamma-aminobutyrate hydrolase family protein [Candidatus Binatia bacterium]
MSSPRSPGAPLIGITADLSTDSRSSTGEAMLLLPQRYCRAIENAGGIPLVLPAVVSGSSLRRILQRLDGLLISGGNFDIHPAYYGEKPIEAVGEVKPKRTESELELARLAVARDLPLLGICGGAQALNVAMGGSLYQDISSEIPNAVEHQLSAKKATGGHRVDVKAGTRLHQILRRRTVEVNTTHHQAVKRLGKGLIVNATAPDGLIEGIESPVHSFVLGLQWHPEVLAPKIPEQRRIFSFFVAICKRARRPA